MLEGNVYSKKESKKENHRRRKKKKKTERKTIKLTNKNRQKYVLFPVCVTVCIELFLLPVTRHYQIFKFI